MSPEATTGDFLYGGEEITAFVNELTARRFTRRQIYRWIESGRLPVGKHGDRALIASKRAIRAHLEKITGAADGTGR
jgi:hypothetical protein